jgi:hypothetical protein
MTTYPPDWEFADTSNPRSLAVGDLFEIALESPKHPPACPNCGDHRVMYARRVTASHRIVTWIGGTKVFAETITAPCPVCQGDALQAWLAEQSGLAGMILDGKPALDIRVADVQPLSGQEAAFELAWRILSELPDTRTWALFSGDFGRGKTHLLAGLVNGARLAGTYAIYTKSESILSALRATYESNAAETTAEVRRRFEFVPVLAVDELDRVQWTEWAGEQLFAILDERYSHGRATWFASNTGPSALASTNRSLGALVSRISAGEIVAVTGSDLRPMIQEGLPDRFNE